VWWCDAMWRASEDALNANSVVACGVGRAHSV
jgi:hypothetical protein